MKFFTKHALWTAIVLLLIQGCSQGPETYKVFMVYSYHPDYNWVAEEIEGVNDVFQNQNITSESFFMDTKRRTSEEWKMKMADSAMKMIELFDPDLVMVFDDNACEYVAKRFLGTKMPVVFCGVNRDPSYYGFPASNITGVREVFPLKNMLGLLQELDPEISKIAFISDKSPTTGGIYESIWQTDIPVEVIDIKATNDFNEWKSVITTWQDQVDAIGIGTYHTITDTVTGESMPPSDVMRWVEENNKLPDFSSFDFAVYDGVLCSYYIPGSQQSSTAAQMALDILGGKSPGEIPVTHPTEGIRLINNNRAEQLGIEIPDEIGATIINE